MIRYLHCSHVLPKRLEALRRAGRQGEMAAEQCTHIIDVIRKSGVHTPEIYNKRTKKGEWRIDNCVKYNLGNGYRLVTVLRKKRLFICFAGSHDEVDTWLENHKEDYFRENSTGYNCEHISHTSETPSLSHVPEQEERDVYEEYIQAQLDDKMLRSIFRGLCQ